MSRTPNFQVVKLVSPTRSLTRRTIFKIHNTFVKFQSVFSNCCIFIGTQSQNQRGRKALHVADAGDELLMEVEWRDARHHAPARGVSKVGQRQTLSLAQWNEQYKARKM